MSLAKHHRAPGGIIARIAITLALQGLHGCPSGGGVSSSGPPVIDSRTPSARDPLLHITLRPTANDAARSMGGGESSALDQRDAGTAATPGASAPMPRVSDEPDSGMAGMGPMKMPPRDVRPPQPTRSPVATPRTDSTRTQSPTAPRTTEHQ